MERPTMNPGAANWETPDPDTGFTRPCGSPHPHDSHIWVRRAPSVFGEAVTSYRCPGA